jgi:hypothetical protein
MSTPPPWGQEPEPPTTPPPPPPTGSPYAPYGAPPSPYGSFQPPQQTNGLAIASLIVSIGSLVFCCGIPAVVGAILGHVARKQIREQDQAGEGLALGGIIVGWIAFGLGMALLIFYVVVVLILGVWAESVDDCYYNDNGNYVCN